jgi:DNA-binding MarR family transcriptional regulator
VAPVPDVTRLLDRLEASGLVRRERDPADRRVVRAAVTAAGLARLAPLDAPLARWIRGRLAGLSRAELAARERRARSRRRFPSTPSRGGIRGGVRREGRSRQTAQGGP